MHMSIRALALGGAIVCAFFLALAAAAAAIGFVLWRERREAEVVARALQDEVAGLRRQAAAMAVEITRRHRAGQGFDPAFFSMWRLSAPLIYPAAGAALGRLGYAALDRVGYFHAQLADARTRLAEARVAGRFEPSPYRMLSCLVRAFNQVEPWLRPDPTGLWPLPDMRDANALLCEFEERAEEPLALAYCWADCAGWGAGAGETGPPDDPLESAEHDLSI